MNIYYLAFQPFLTSSQKDVLNSLGTLALVDATNKSVENIIESVVEADVIITGSGCIKNFSAEVFKGLPRLKLLALTCVGTDWIDLDAAKQYKVEIVTAKGANAESVAEHAWGMIIDLSKRITEADRDVRLKEMYSHTDYPGNEVFGKTLGIIGFGAVGKKVERIAKAFEMRVLAYDVFHTDYSGIEWAELNDLCQASDIICVSVALTKETENLVSFDQFKLMKPGVLLINIAREQIVNKAAILDALESGKVAGYGLETPIGDRLSHDDPYLKYHRVIVTPHIAFNTAESVMASLDMAISQVQAYASQFKR